MALRGDAKETPSNKTWLLFNGLCNSPPEQTSGGHLRDLWGFWTTFLSREVQPRVSPLRRLTSARHKTKEHLDILGTLLFIF